MRSSSSLLLLVSVAMLCSSACLAQSSVPSTTVKLWEHGIPGSELNEDGDVPELIIHQVSSSQPTAGVVILPGGGYGGHAIGHEGHEFAAWFDSLGISSAICTYRMRGKGNEGKGYGHPAPMIDAQRAIQTLRSRAKELNLDPNRIGVIGFSAGGHLASTVSTQFVAADPDAADPVLHVSSRPDFSILCYPVIAFGKPFTHRGSQVNLLGNDADAALVESLSNETRVSDQTPPTFLFHTAEDKAVPVQNSLVYYQACVEHGVDAEMHLFNAGRHGLGLAASEPGASLWPGLCHQWLIRHSMATAQ